MLLPNGARAWHHTHGTRFGAKGAGQMRKLLDSDPLTPEGGTLIEDDTLGTGSGDELPLDDISGDPD